MVRSMLNDRKLLGSSKIIQISLDAHNHSRIVSSWVHMKTIYVLVLFKLDLLEMTIYVAFPKYNSHKHALKDM